jgi:hypothetical protein
VRQGLCQALYRLTRCCCKWPCLHDWPACAHVAHATAAGCCAGWRCCCSGRAMILLGVYAASRCGWVAAAAVTSAMTLRRWQDRLLNKRNHTHFLRKAFFLLSCHVCGGRAFLLVTPLFCTPRLQTGNSSRSLGQGLREIHC